MSLFGGKRKDGGGTPPPARPASGSAGSTPPAATTSREPEARPSAPPATTQDAPAGTPERRSITDKLRMKAPEEAPQGGNTVATIGKSIIFKGELTGEEDLEIDGKVEGSVRLPNHQLTIGAHGQVTADVSAKAVQVVGHVAGNVVATERVEVQASGIVEGDIKAPRLLVQEGAVINGAIEMTKQAGAAQGAQGAQGQRSESGKPAAEAGKPGGGEPVRKSA